MAADPEKYTREDICCELNKLIEKLEKAEHSKDCYPRKIYPECPEPSPPGPMLIAHPLVRGLNVVSLPKSIQHNVKVTVDGRLAENSPSTEYFYEEPPLRLPPWVRPRIPSFELRGGNFYRCQCYKNDGMKEYCERWDCGRPECLTSPLPECPPGFDPPITGIRKGNALMSPIMPARGSPILPTPYPTAAPVSNKVPVPNPPYAPCPLHYQFMKPCAH